MRSAELSEAGLTGVDADADTELTSVQAGTFRQAKLTAQLASALDLPRGEDGALGVILVGESES
ncbi:hypothetical protein Q1M63_00105 (plasmid) [Sinorhizobium meliloti]|nr:hypothetical protein Q1M63_00105 [Sinorhizobium meliloti]